jgi:hypothetical protein
MELNEASHNYSELQEQYTSLRDEKAALQEPTMELRIQSNYITRQLVAILRPGRVENAYITLGINGTQHTHTSHKLPPPT